METQIRGSANKICVFFPFRQVFSRRQKNFLALLVGLVSYTKQPQHLSVCRGGQYKIQQHNIQHNLVLNSRMELQNRHSGGAAEASTVPSFKLKLNLLTGLYTEDCTQVMSFSILCPQTTEHVSPVIAKCLERAQKCL